MFGVKQEHGQRFVAVTHQGQPEKNGREMKEHSLFRQLDLPIPKPVFNDRGTLAAKRKMTGQQGHQPNNTR